MKKFTDMVYRQSDVWLFSNILAERLKKSERLVSAGMSDVVQRALDEAKNIKANKIAVTEIIDDKKNFWVTFSWNLLSLDPNISFKQAYDEDRDIFYGVKTISKEATYDYNDIVNLIRDLYNLPGLIVLEREAVVGFISLADFSESELELVKKTPLTIEQIELKAKLKGGLVGASLHDSYTGIDLQDADLREADLSGADLSKANLQRADLTGANLSNARLADADLQYANLKDSVLVSANLKLAKLNNAVLYNASLTSANLDGADLRNADLSNADLSKANLQRADLTGANLSNARLADAKLIRAKLNGANLKDAILIRADLRFAQLWHADLENADLQYANLKDSVLFSTNLKLAKLNNADLYNAGLMSANLEGADLYCADISNANLKYADFDEKTDLKDIIINSITIDNLTDSALKADWNPEVKQFLKEKYG